MVSHSWFEGRGGACWLVKGPIEASAIAEVLTDRPNFGI
jgi:hypothetical protein